MKKKLRLVLIQSTKEHKGIYQNVKSNKLTLYQDYSAIEVAGIGTAEVVVAMAATIAISFLALKLLRKTVIAGKFYMFAFYCFIIGAVLLILHSIGF